MAPYLIDASIQMGDPPSQAQITYLYSDFGGGHSILFGEWFFQGIGAGVFYLVAGIIYIRLGVYFFRKDSLLTPLLGAGCIEFTWHLLFSPYKTDTRLFIGLIFAVFFLLRKHPFFETQIQSEFFLKRRWADILSLKRSF